LCLSSEHGQRQLSAFSDAKTEFRFYKLDERLEFKSPEPLLSDKQVNILASMKEENIAKVSGC